LTSSSCLSRAENCISGGYLCRDAEVGRDEGSHGRPQNHERDRIPLTSSASGDGESRIDDEESQTGDEESQSGDEESQTDKLPHPEVRAFTDWFIESIRSPPSERLHVAHGEILPQWSKNMSYQSYATQLAKLCTRQKKVQDVLANLLKFTAGCIYEASRRLPTLRIEDNDIGVEDSSPRTTMFRLSKQMAFINRVVDSLRPHWGDQALDIYQLLGEFRSFVYRMLSVANSSLANTKTFKNFYKLSDAQQEEAAKLVVHKLYANPPDKRPSNPYNPVLTVSTLLQLRYLVYSIRSSQKADTSYRSKIITQALFPVNRRIVVAAASVDKPGTRAANESTKRRFIDTNSAVGISCNKRQLKESHLDGSDDPTDNALLVQEIQAQFQQQQPSTASLPSIVTALSIETPRTSYNGDAGPSTNMQTTNLATMDWNITNPQTTNLGNITDQQTTNLENITDQQITNLATMGWNITDRQTTNLQTTNLANIGTGWNVNNS
jgi:hypothetical protein